MPKVTQGVGRYDVPRGLIEELEHEDPGPQPRVYVSAEERCRQAFRSLKRLTTAKHQPTVREIAVDMELKSTASVHRYLNMLVEQGKVKQVYGRYVINN